MAGTPRRSELTELTAGSGRSSTCGRRVRPPFRQGVSRSLGGGQSATRRPLCRFASVGRRGRCRHRPGPRRAVPVVGCAHDDRQVRPMRQEVASLRFGRYVACGSPGALAFRGNRCRRSTRRCAWPSQGGSLRSSTSRNRLAKVDVAGYGAPSTSACFDGDDGARAGRLGPDPRRLRALEGRRGGGARHARAARGDGRRVRAGARGAAGRARSSDRPATTRTTASPAATRRVAMRVRGASTRPAAWRCARDADGERSTVEIALVAPGRARRRAARPRRHRPRACPAEAGA